MPVTHDLVDLVGNLTWPLTAIFLALILKKTIVGMGESVASSIKERATKVQVEACGQKFSLELERVKEDVVGNSTLAKAQVAVGRETAVLDSKTPIETIIKSDLMVEDSLLNLLAGAGGRAEVAGANLYQITALATARELIPPEMAITIRRLHQARQAAERYGAQIFREDAQEYASIALAVQKVIEGQKGGKKVTQGPQQRPYGLQMNDRVGLFRSLAPILLPDERDPKNLVDLVLETSEEEVERLIQQRKDLTVVPEDELAWLMICAVYKGTSGLQRLATACADSRIAAEFLATFFALSHMRPWRATVYRIAIVFGLFSPDSQRYFQSLIDRIIVQPPETEWELGALGAAVEGGVDAVVAAFHDNAARLGLPPDRVASFNRCLD